MNTDVVIIGGGVTGTAIARELSRYNLDIILLEKEADVAAGTSKANSGIIHAGYNAPEKTLKGRLNVRANPMFDEICRDLKVPFKRIGSLVVGFNDEDLKVLKMEKENGEKQGIEGLKIIKKQELLAREPKLNPGAKYALYAPTAGIISPYELTIAYADNAVINGVKVLLETEAEDLIIKNNKIQGIKTNKGEIKASVVINAAGIFADRIAKMAGDNFTIKPRKGEYHLYDKEYGDLVNHVLFPIPDETSKGILVTPTVHGNLLIGPNSQWTEDKTDVSTSKPGLKEVVGGAKKLIPDLPENGVITSFAGLRAAASGEDFIIGFADEVRGLINAAGIQSPGLSSAPAIAEEVIELVKEYITTEIKELGMTEKEEFQKTLPATPAFYEYEGKEGEWQQYIEKNDDYGEIICRCEHVTRGEIVRAIHRPVPARTLDAIKRRTRAGSGRCQQGFCGPRIVEILAEELNISPLEVTKKGGNSNILRAYSKQLIETEKAGEKENEA